MEQPTHRLDQGNYVYFSKIEFRMGQLGQCEKVSRLSRSITENHYPIPFAACVIPSRMIREYVL